MSVDTSIDYYDVLRAREDATPAEIHSAYRRQLNAHHPDRGGSTTDAQRINEAYTVLSDPAARAAYDGARERERVAAAPTPAPAPSYPAGAPTDTAASDRGSSRLPPQTVFMIRLVRAAEAAGKTAFMVGWILLGLFLGFVGLLLFAFGLDNETSRAWAPLVNIGGLVLAVLWVLIPLRVNKALAAHNARANENVQRQYGGC